MNDHEQLYLAPLQQHQNLAAACYGHKLLHQNLPPALHHLKPEITNTAYATKHPIIRIPNIPHITSRTLDKSPIVFSIKLLQTVYWDLLLEQFKKAV